MLKNLKINTKLFLILLAVVALFVLGAYFNNFRLQNEYIKNVLLLNVNFTKATFQDFKERDTKLLSSTLEAISQDSAIKKIYLEKDREKLYDYTAPLFKNLKDKYNITHWYFILPDGHTFLRLHQKDLYGDEIKRVTFLKARETKEINSGIELGKTAYALRVVTPYFSDGELIGYIELGEEIGQFLNVLKQMTVNEFFLTADKIYLDRENWQSIRRTAGLRDNWNDSKEHLVLASTSQTTAGNECFTDENLEKAEAGEVLFQQVRDGVKIFQCAGFVVNDASGRHVGSLLFLTDISEYVAAAKRTIRTVIILSAILFLFTFIFIFFISQSIINSIKKLIQGTEIVSQGKLDHKIAIDSRDEISQLSRAFNEMAEKMRDREQNLKNAKIAAKNVYEDLLVEKERIAKNKAKEDALLASIGEGVVAVDADGKIILINHAAEVMLGWSAEQVMGKLLVDIWKVLDEKENPISEAERPIAAALRGRTTTTTTTTGPSYFYTRKDGTKFPVAINVTPAVAENKIIGAIDVFRDITRERAIDKAKSEFISIASHQLRTPLTGIKWFSQLLIGQKVGKLSAKQTDFIQQMYNSNERMIRLVNDLLDVSRIETGQKFTIEKKPGDIISLINKVIQDQKIDWPAKKITIKLDKSCPAKLIFSFDQDKIYQAFSNLISNSIKYSGQGKEIIVGLKQLGDQTRFFVKDFGLGIPERQKNRVFHKFFRADNIAAISTDGTGLGLYIVKGIVEAHGGKIWFESVENKGTTFYFTL